MNQSLPGMYDTDLGALRAEVLRRGAAARDVHDESLRVLLERFSFAQAADAYMMISGGKTYAP